MLRRPPPNQPDFGRRLRPWWSPDRGGSQPDPPSRPGSAEPGRGV
jgi:hypothetical protein